MAKKGFNLLRPQIEPPTVWTKLYDYVVGTARVIVIIVELVVVAAFVIRIVVDVQSKNLDEQIQSKEFVVKAFQDSESTYRSIQNKTAAYEGVWTNSPILLPIYSEINSYIPDSSNEITIQLDAERVAISGTARVSDIGLLENAFKSTSTFIGQELNQIESQGNTTDVLGEFSFTADVRNITMREIIDVNLDNNTTITPTPDNLFDNSNLFTPTP